MVSRLRDDADLRYKYTQEQSTGRGRPRKYDGKVDFNKINYLGASPRSIQRKLFESFRGKPRGIKLLAIALRLKIKCHKRDSETSSE